MTAAEEKRKESKDDDMDTSEAITTKSERASVVGVTESGDPLRTQEKRCRLGDVTGHS